MSGAEFLAEWREARRVREERERQERLAAATSGEVPDTEELEGIVCPWCAHEHTEDLWEIIQPFDEDTTTACRSCGREFKVAVYTSVSYTTTRPEGAS